MSDETQPVETVTPEATEVAEAPQTFLPQQDVAPAGAEPRRQTSGIRIGDALALVGALVASIALTTVFGGTVAPVHGFLAFLLIAYALFLVIYGVLVWLDESNSVVADRTIAIFVHSGAFVLVLALTAVLTYPMFKGGSAFLHWNLFSQDMSTTGPLDALTKGGAGHAIVGTLMEIGIALAITIPLGITTALFLTEVPGPFARFVRTIVEAMTALPSVVAGLFILSSFILILGFDKSGLAAGLAITVMMLPIMIRAADVVFRLVPGTLKEASLGLGASQFKTVMHVVLPTARSGLTTAIILATARGIGETSPVLLTAGFAASLNWDPLHGPMVSLPLEVFELVKSPQPNMVARGFATAIVLMLLVLLLFVTARILGAQDVAKKAKRKARRQALARRLQDLRARIRPTTPDVEGLETPSLRKGSRPTNPRSSHA